MKNSIVCSAAEVRAWMGGKTQMRLPVMPQPQRFFEVNESPFYLYDVEWDIGIINPPFQVGQVIYVKETWRDTGVISEPYAYKANEEALNLIGESGQILSIKYRWRSPVTMPRDAARLWLRITGVRVERLQEITLDDCRKEGCCCSDCLPIGKHSESCKCDTLFFNTWNSLPRNKGYLWDSNPYVWTYTAERVEKG